MRQSNYKLIGFYLIVDDPDFLETLKRCEQRQLEGGLRVQLGIKYRYERDYLCGLSRFVKFIANNEHDD